MPTACAAGSVSEIQTLDQWRERWMRAWRDPDGFWLEQTRRRLSWRQQPTKGLEGDFSSVVDAPLRWFADGRLNITESCLDQHLSARGDKVAIIWEADEPGEGRSITYSALHAEVERAAAALRAADVKPGDRVIIYMGMVPEAAVAMLACARVGAVHSVVFGGFSAEALRDRVLDCDAKLILTQDEGLRGGRTIPLKATVDQALSVGAHPVTQVGLPAHRRRREAATWSRPDVGRRHGRR